MCVRERERERKRERERERKRERDLPPLAIYLNCIRSLSQFQNKKKIEKKRREREIKYIHRGAPE